MLKPSGLNSDLSQIPDIQFPTLNYKFCTEEWLKSLLGYSLT